MGTLFELICVESKLSNLIFDNLLFVLVMYWANLIFPSKKILAHIGFFSNCGVSFCLCVLLVSRWIISGYLPLSNLYESLIFLSWGMLMLSTLLESQSKISSIGAINTPIILLVILFAKALLPDSMNMPSSLAPSLKSNWLIIHVTIILLSYVTLLTGSLLSIIFLSLTTKSTKKKLLKVNYARVSSDLLRIKKKAFYKKIISVYLTANWQSKFVVTRTPNFCVKINRVSKRLNLLESIDNLSYRTICFGFPLLTLGILTGSVWANEAWGACWSWDPKETWALVTWLTFASYLHSRIAKSWRGRKPAIIALIGFNIIWLCYFGVNFLGNGLHTYGQVIK